MKKVLRTLSVAAMLMACVSGCKKNTSKELSFATGGASGTYFPFGSAMAGIWNTHIENLAVSVQTTAASAENLSLLSAGKVDLAIVQNDVLDYAYNGTGMFTSCLQNLSTVCTLYPEVVQIFTSRQSGITSIAELRGKRVSVGEAGSGIEFNAAQILEGYGLSFADIQKENLSFRDSTEGIRNGTIDACFFTSGLPNTALLELAFTNGFDLIPVTDAASAEICRKYGFYTRTVIPAGTYAGIETDVSALAIKAALIASEKLDADIVYTMTQTLFSNLEYLSSAHAKGREVSAATAICGVSVPFHPGAVKYFKEIGLHVE
ncbi:MAG: TAXI family TRAP transporter solute-binding subunit [Treponema sp.]|nr:TAXI family TRAP transporter solute-binding subunit [Treponema sp.]